MSSSASVEISSGLAISHLLNRPVDKLELARIGQQAEHQYVGVKCGLLDQITSLFAVEQSLIMIDFRALEFSTLSLPDGVSILLCDTQVKHTLVDGEYNERRQQCEAAVSYFDSALEGTITALRDVG